MLNFHDFSVYAVYILSIDTLISEQDVALSILFALGFLPGAITEAAWADGWSEWQDYVEELEDVHGSDGADDIVDELDFYPGRIFGAMVSSAVSEPLGVYVYM